MKFKINTFTKIEEISFLEELENRLNDLEKEISKIRKPKDNSYHMENMIHNFDSAMDNEPVTEIAEPVLLEKRFRYLDY